MAPHPKPRRTRARTFLLEWREFRDLTQEQAADRVGISRTTIGRIESGKIPYNQDFLEKAALAYGCDVTDLLSVNPLQPDPPKLVYSRLKAAPKPIQEYALAVLDALLKTGS